ncbi:3-oxoacyl-ACP reductase [Paenibacillus dokdonensis]|uniref:3-oxoacyl-ACP reductase n=2 Tax=Paenibacillus dokdonensis TaxID=2567944 RepID=A0ABU6GRY3_9BACL|nr:3-oxoacyl-ACP reductase [Paenibacillus dokdonensis]MEC0241988.1 3-oxoacyl-ACP reductase [Paenibacillus dokdonensis]
MLKTLKMSTEKLKAKSFQLADTSDHPNKVSFKCALFAVDQPSDGSPMGAGGKKIRISSSVCDQYLQTFVGMAFNIDYVNGMTDHDPRFKVAVIEKAYRSMDGFAWVDGYVYGKDFPDVIATIRYYNGLVEKYGWTEYQFGASLEMTASVQNATDDENILDVMEFCGTGAAILFAESAAFKTTSFAAKNDKPNEEVSDMDEKVLKELLEGFKSDIAASITEVKTEVGAIKTELESVKATKEAEDKKNEEDQAAADLKAAKDEAEALKQELADLKAGKTTEPERKTATAAQLLAKFGKTMGEGEGEDHASFCATVDKMGLDSVQSLTLKLKHKEISNQQ